MTHTRVFLADGSLLLSKLSAGCAPTLPRKDAAFAVDPAVPGVCTLANSKRQRWDLLGFHRIPTQNSHWKGQRNVENDEVLSKLLLVATTIVSVLADPPRAYLMDEVIDDPSMLTNRTAP